MIGTVSIAILIIRLVVGLTMVTHGTEKAFGWFGGFGPTQTKSFLDSLGYKPAWLWFYLAVLGEIGGGLSFLLGFFTPLGVAGIFGTMFMAVFKIHRKNGFSNLKGGYEYPLTMMAVVLAVGISGPGIFSVDSILKIGIPELQLLVVFVLAATLVDLAGIFSPRLARLVPVTGKPPSS